MDDSGDGFGGAGCNAASCDFNSGGFNGENKDKDGGFGGGGGGIVMGVVAVVVTTVVGEVHKIKVVEVEDHKLKMIWAT